MRATPITRDVQIALAVWTAEVARARRAYYAEPTEHQQALARAKATRKAANQQKYRDKLKEAS